MLFISRSEPADLLLLTNNQMNPFKDPERGEPAPGLGSSAMHEKIPAKGRVLPGTATRISIDTYYLARCLLA